MESESGVLCTLLVLLAASAREGYEYRAREVRVITKPAAHFIAVHSWPATYAKASSSSFDRASSEFRMARCSARLTTSSITRSRSRAAASSSADFHGSDRSGPTPETARSLPAE